MPSPTYTAKGVVIRKTKLGESDVICTLLDESGQQVRAVAKGARKPTSSFSSRLELGSVVSLLLVKGKSLDVVKEARLEDANEFLRGDFLRSTACAPMLELAERVSETGLEQPRLFGLTCRALAALGECSDEQVSCMTAAHLIKGIAIIGLRPSLDVCVSCGEQVDFAAGGSVNFSYSEGGVVCDSCSGAVRESIRCDASTLSWCRVLMLSTFDDLLAMEMDARVGFSVLEMCQRLCVEHIGARLKSIDFMMTCGMF